MMKAGQGTGRMPDQENGASGVGHGDHANGEDNNHNTRERILQAAREVFLERGFAKATIREICSRAGANVAAVHYHFSDKDGVYKAVLDALVLEGMQRYPQNMGLGENATPEERLHAYISSLMHRVLLGGGDDFERQSRLLSEAMVTPSPFLDDLVEWYIRPSVRELWEILREILGEDINEKVFLACSASVLGQCLHYFFTRPILDRMRTGLYEGPEDVDRLARHVTRFTLGGIRAVLEGEAEASSQEGAA